MDLFNTHALISSYENVLWTREEATAVFKQLQNQCA